MKAVVITKSGIQVVDVAKPTPRPHEVLINVRAATVTAGDVVLKGLPGFLYWPPVRKVLGVPPKKSTPGHEFAGEVAAVGSAVTRFKPGDLVFGTTTGLKTGANAEYVCLPETWATGVLALKPASMTFAEAAAVPVGGMTALYLLRQANIQPGQQVLIYGASGSVGTYAVQLARHLGAQVTGVASTRNVALVESLGADRVIDYTQEDFSQSGETYDVIFDAVGKSSPARSKTVLKDGGHSLSIRSTTHESPDLLQFLIQRIEAGEIQVVIDQHYPLDQIAEAYQYVASGRKRGNVILTVADDGDLESLKVMHLGTAPTR